MSVDVVPSSDPPEYLVDLDDEFPALAATASANSCGAGGLRVLVDSGIANGEATMSLVWPIFRRLLLGCTDPFDGTLPGRSLEDSLEAGKLVDGDMALLALSFPLSSFEEADNVLLLD
jgi:hypothetical protein